MSKDTARTRPDFRHAKRIVIKIGSALLMDETGNGVNRNVFRQVSKEIAAFRSLDSEVIVVSSGAIAIGIEEMGFAGKEVDMAGRQALAAVGQSQLMSCWRESLSEHGFSVAQVLLTHEDLRNRKRYLNARHAMLSMLEFGAIPIVNENDTVATEEIELGDNDNLSAQVAALVSADLLIILSLFDGLYDHDPQHHPEAKRMPVVEKIDSSVMKLGASGVSSAGTGGMVTKIQSAKTAGLFGIPTVVASGRIPKILESIRKGSDVGTLFLPNSDPVNARKHWIAFTLKPVGNLIVDTGAANALRKRGSSLLPSGILSVKGEFDKGDLVCVFEQSGDEVARGLTSYPSQDIAQIAGCRSEEISERLGYNHSDVVIHRDDLVVL